MAPSALTQANSQARRAASPSWLLHLVGVAALLVVTVSVQGCRDADNRSEAEKKAALAGAKSGEAMKNADKAEEARELADEKSQKADEASAKAAWQLATVLGEETDKSQREADKKGEELQSRVDEQKRDLQEKSRAEQEKIIGAGMAAKQNAAAPEPVGQPDAKKHKPEPAGTAEAAAVEAQDPEKANEVIDLTEEPEQQEPADTAEAAAGEAQDLEKANEVIDPAEVPEQQEQDSDKTESQEPESQEPDDTETQPESKQTGDDGTQSITDSDVAEPEAVKPKTARTLGTGGPRGLDPPLSEQAEAGAQEDSADPVVSLAQVHQSRGGSGNAAARRCVGEGCAASSHGSSMEEEGLVTRRLVGIREHELGEA